MDASTLQVENRRYIEVTYMCCIEVAWGILALDGFGSLGTLNPEPKTLDPEP